MKKRFLAIIYIICALLFALAVVTAIDVGISLLDSFHFHGACSSFQNSPNCPDGGYLGQKFFASIVVSLLLGSLLIFLNRLRKRN